MEPKMNKKPHGRPWAMGQSGNPGGRPKANPQVVEILKAATPVAAELLVSLVSNEQVPLKLRLQAAETILDRVYGRPTQPIDATIGGNGEPIVLKFEGLLQQWSQ